MPAIKHRKHALDIDSAWKWDADTQDAVLGEPPDWSRYEQAHAWFDAEADKATKGAYKLPHHSGPELTTNWSGVVAAMGALLGARGGVELPESDRKAVYDHLAAHYREFDKEPPELKPISASEFRGWHLLFCDVDVDVLLGLELRPRAQKPRRLATDLPVVMKPKLRPVPTGTPSTWFDALRTGSFLGYPSPDGLGIEVTDETIDELAESVNASEQPIPLDGGSISGVHEMPEDSGASAAGWITEAATTTDDLGRKHLWLYGYVPADVAAKIESCELLYGSVAYATRARDPESGREMHRLHSYALTNKPFIPGLAPHRMGRSKPGELRLALGDVLAVVAMSERATNRRKIDMDPKTLMLTYLRSLLGSDVEGKSDDQLATAFESVVQDAVKAKLTPADEQTKADPVEQNTAHGNEQATIAAPQKQHDDAAMPQALAEARAEIIALRAEVERLVKSHEQTENDKRKAEVDAYLDKQIKDRKLSLSADDRAVLAGVAMAHGIETLDKVLARSHRPPSGLAMEPRANDGRERAFSTKSEALTALMAEVRKERPNANEYDVRREALRRLPRDLALAVG